jgi:hypothetical protein
MTSKLLAFAIAVSVLFYCVVPLLYVFPRIAESRIIGRTMFLIAFFVVAPTWATFLVRLYRSGLKTGGAYRVTGGQG